VLVELSMREGISVVDVDRVIARVGAGRCVERLGHYRAEGATAVVEELDRVLADYGFFDDRPLLEQVGQRVPAR
jgi:hypothetical protein